MNSKQLENWRGLFGDAYAERNVVTAERMRAYTRAFAHIWDRFGVDEPSTVLECGCNVGLALRAISSITGADLKAIEPNAKARALAASANVTTNQNISNGCVQDIPFPDASVDLAFTSGVLIHVAPEDLDRAMDELGRVSRKYVLMIEYFSKEVSEISYRGQNEMLWKADYGRLFMARNPGWQPLDAGFFWHETTGFDDSNWWLFRRTE